MKIKPLLFALMLILFFSQKAYACGCGIAITDMKVFNALKETQAYLLIDVKDKGSYDEMPFFRFVSMDRPYNVTIVFPMDQIPYDVQGKKITASDFLYNYGINNAEDQIKNQDWAELVKNIDKPLFLASNGAMALVPLLVWSFGTMSAGSKIGMTNSALAHFEFEGGSLDIYNVSSAQTLDEFVNSLGINVTDKVKDLVTKYNNYFVAVLRLQVPSLISDDKMNYLESCAPNALKGIQDELSQNSEISYNEIQSMIYRYPNNCGEQGNEYLREYISAATYTSDAVNGTLVTMKFRNSNSFFYPTSIVNSYKYPINDQKYYIKVPESLSIDLSSSSASKMVNSGGYRWYKIESTQDDLKGKVVDSNFLVSLGDFGRKVVVALNENLSSIILFLYVLALALPLIVFNRLEKINLKTASLTIVAYLFGGLILSSIVMLVNRKKMTALTYFGIWILLLIIFATTL